MSHFLARLIEKETHPEAVIQPRVPARFEPFPAAEAAEAGSSDRPETGSVSAMNPLQPEAPIRETQRASSIPEVPLREIIRERQSSIQQLHILHSNDEKPAPLPLQPQVIIQRLVADNNNQQREPSLKSKQLSALPPQAVPEPSVSLTPPLPAPQPVAFQPEANQNPVQETAASASQPDHSPQTVETRSKRGDFKTTLPFLPMPNPQSALHLDNSLTPAPQPTNNQPYQRRNLSAQEKLTRAADNSTKPTTIQVTIGRVEVRAIPAAKPQNRPQKAAKVMSLDDYLRQRGGKS